MRTEDLIRADLEVDADAGYAAFGSDVFCYSTGLGIFNFAVEGEDSAVAFVQHQALLPAF